MRTCQHGFHYLYIQLNKFKRKIAKEKYNYTKNYGWVLFEFPYTRYKYNEDEQIVHDDKNPRAQIAIFYKSYKDSQHYSALHNLK